MAVTAGKLWHHPDFLKLWAGQTVSEVGSQVTLLALPLAAIRQLHASSAAVGALRTFETLPFLLFGLLAGVWVDRWPRRPLLIGADLGRLVVLASVPLAWAAGVLTVGQLFVVGFAVGALTTFFDVAYQSYLPALIPREDLVEGNAKLALSQSAGAVAGPGIAGVLIGAVGAATALGADAASFLASILGVATIRRREPPVGRTAGDASSVRGEVAEGLRFVLGQRQLRLLAGATATYNLFLQAFELILLLYLARTLHLAAAVIGLVLVVSSVGYIVGSLGAPRLGRSIGMGPVFVAGLAVSGLGALATPLAGAAVAGICVALAVNSLGVPLYNVNQLSYRQSICPDRLQGRMNATMRFLVWGTLPVGGLLGGLLAEALGPRTALWVAAAGETAAVAWTLAAPLRRLRAIPDAASAS